MIPALLGLLAPVAAVKALTQLARAAGAALRSTASPVTPPVPPAVETAHEVSAGSKNKYVVFTYYRLGQLIGVDLNQTAQERYVFDDSGNLTSLTVGNTTTTFSANNLNQQTAPGTHVYDAKGQKTTLDGKTFEWDDQGRVTAIVQGTTRSEFAYDGMSRRTKITEYANGTVTSKKLYFWLGGTIVCERDGLVAGFPITKQYFGIGEVRGNTKLFYTMDHLLSIRELVESSGVVQAAYRYSTYGERAKLSGNLDCDRGYAGLWHHAPSGLDLATYRLYDAANKRWISRDPLGEGVDYNLYRYVGNSPINFNDPLGLARKKKPGNHDVFYEPDPIDDVTRAMLKCNVLNSRPVICHALKIGCYAACLSPVNFRQESLPNLLSYESDLCYAACEIAYARCMTQGAYPGSGDGILLLSR